MHDLLWRHVPDAPHGWVAVSGLHHGHLYLNAWALPQARSGARPRCYGLRVSSPMGAAESARAAMAPADEFGDISSIIVAGKTVTTEPSELDSDKIPLAGATGIIVAFEGSADDDVDVDGTGARHSLISWGQWRHATVRHLERQRHAIGALGDRMKWLATGSGLRELYRESSTFLGAYTSAMSAAGKELQKLAKAAIDRLER